MTAKIKLNHANGNGVSLNAPANNPSISDVAFKLPQADGSNGQFMKTDGSGNLAFATVADTNDYVKLQRATNGGVASELIFDNLDVATYKFFELFLAFVPSNDSVKPYFRFRTGGSSGADVNGAHYAYGYRESYPSGNGLDVSESSQNEIRLGGSVGYNTNNGEGFRINMRMMFADSSDNGSAQRLSNWITWGASRLDGGSNYRANNGNGIYNENLTTYPTGFKTTYGKWNS